MDFNLIFLKEVIDKYRIDKLLTPKRIGNGELENVILSDLRKELNFAFLDIEGYTFKDELLNYIEDFSVRLRALSIPTQKNKVKRIKKKIILLENTHPNLDINNTKDEIVIEEINNLQWVYSQEKYILDFLKEQKSFVHNWVAEKRKEFKEEPIKAWIEKERSKINTRNLIDNILQNKHKTVVSKDYHFYCEIGALFAQNYIRTKSENNNTSYIYIDEVFTNPHQLSKYIKEEILKSKKSVHQYVSDTLQNNDAPHNFYKSQIKMKNILQYCNDKHIVVENENFIKSMPKE